MTDMTLDSVMALIKFEELERYAVFGHPRNATNSTAIYEEDGHWHVINTDERAVPGAHRTFQTESEALELFLRRLRLSAQIQSYRNERKTER